MIYLLRHGEDDENYIGGWSNVELTKKGIKQIKEISEVIQKLEIEAIYTSDIKRAIQTAQIIANKINIDVNQVSYLRELDKGKLTGMEVEVAKRDWKEYFNLTICQKYPDGESMIDLYERVKKSIKYLKNNSLYVTHRGYINIIYFILNNRPIDMNKSQFNVEHASLHELDLEKKLIRRIK